MNSLVFGSQNSFKHRSDGEEKDSFLRNNSIRPGTLQLLAHSILPNALVGNYNYSVSQMKAFRIDLLDGEHGLGGGGCGLQGFHGLGERRKTEWR